MAQDNLQTGLILREYKDEPLTIEEMDMNLRMLAVSASGARAVRNDMLANIIALMPKAPTISQVINELSNKGEASLEDLFKAIPSYYYDERIKCYIFVIIAEKGDTKGISSYIDKERVDIYAVLTIYNNLLFTNKEIDGSRCPILTVYALKEKQTSNSGNAEE